MKSSRAIVSGAFGFVAFTAGASSRLKLNGKQHSFMAPHNIDANARCKLVLLGNGLVE
tara:strand:+ start:280 stop:453 length:174 start_codon:yes stop_codon:yes gene_type:complete